MLRTRARIQVTALLVAFALMALGVGHVYAAGEIHVTTSGAGSMDGSDWDNATTLQDALQNRAGDGDEIWVASGVYTPGVNITDTFSLPPGVAMYGGFAGTESERSQRSWIVNETVLSGDIGGDDITNESKMVENAQNIRGDNSLHVITVDGLSTPVSSSTVLDGFGITAGDAGDAIPNGGGFLCKGSGAGSECSPTLSQLALYGNRAANLGGAMYNDGYGGGASSPSLEYVIFLGNSATDGGAVYNDGNFGHSSPRLNRVIFSGNRAKEQGGAMYNRGDNGLSDPTLTNVLFSGNLARLGGAMLNFGAIDGTSRPSLTNVTFSGNKATENGGAIYNDGFNGVSQPSLTNVILWGNDATVTGTQLFNNFAGPITITTSLVQGGVAGPGIVNDASVVADGGGNVDADPLFADPIDASSAPTITNAFGGLQLQFASPAIDTGTNDAIAQTRDLNNRPRIVDGDWDGNAIVDMGAYEDVYCPYVSVLHVDRNVTVAGLGQSWDSAFASPRLAFNAARSCRGIEEIWVATGVYTPGLSANDTFTLPAGVGVYGGFAATETLRTQRNWAANPTVLSGDLDGDDATDAHGVTRTVADIIGSNANHVVSIDGMGSNVISDTTVLDGFTITGGQANGGSFEKNHGGGMVCLGNNPGGYCSPLLRNLAFSGNMAEVGGGALYNAGYNGGASGPKLYNVAFFGNEAVYGGAVLNDAYNGGASSPYLYNVTFYGNDATESGGAMYSDGRDNGDSSPSLINTILWGNTASPGGGDQLYNLDAHLDIGESLVQGGVNGPGVVNDGGSVNDFGVMLSSDPLFVDASNGDLRLQTGSPAIDQGDNGVINLTRDLGAKPRKLDGDGDGTATVDMGAYEAATHYLLTVNKAGDGGGQVTSQPAGIDCGSACTAPLAETSAVTLTAGADADSTFAGWSGACNGGGSCTLTLSSAKVVTATFTLKPVAPTTGSVQGSVVDGDGAAVPGAEVTLTSETGAAVDALTRTMPTDPQGGYLFEDVPAGAYSLTASKNGYQTAGPQTVTVKTGVTETVDPVVLQKNEPPSGPAIYLPALTGGASASSAHVERDAHLFLPSMGR